MENKTAFISVRVTKAFKKGLKKKAKKKGVTLTQLLLDLIDPQDTKPTQ